MPDRDELDRPWQFDEAEPNRPSGFEAGLRRLWPRLWPVRILVAAVMWEWLFGRVGWAALWLVIAVLLVGPLAHLIGGKIGKWLYPQSGTDC
jgi:hypothetical protein